MIQKFRYILYRVNLEEAIFMCSKEECLWPLAGTHKPEEVLGKSNSSILGQIKDEKRRMDKETESFENVFMNKSSHQYFEKLLM